ncbi:hypothetical protein K492DRAFT_227161 [Lichtheimia hyalospora FSU 10163]|nr:hypothetical protein K492DRAFT_227161 [Lichtheimia hyalospora FSU 10163]
MLTPPRPIKLDPKLSFSKEQFIQWDANTCFAYMPLRDWGDVTAISLNIIERYPTISKSHHAHQLLSSALSQISAESDDEPLRFYSKTMNVYLNTKAVKRRFKIIFRYKHTVARLQESVDHQMEIDHLKATLLVARKVSRKFDNELQLLK